MPNSQDLEFVRFAGLLFGGDSAVRIIFSLPRLAGTKFEIRSKV